MRSYGRCILLILLLPAFGLIPPVVIRAQESATGTGTTGEQEATGESFYDKTLALDIDTANYYELYAWCLKNGIDPSGDVEQLRQKLKQFYKVAGVAASTSPEQTAAKKPTKTIIIKSANDSEYFKIDEIDEKYMVLKGDVYVEVIDSAENVIHRINAQKITLNQTENNMTAEHDVMYTIIRGSEKPEVFRGESFSFNLNSWDGVFYKAKGTTAGEVAEKDSVEFMFYGKTISRLSNDTIILDEGGVTSSHDKEDPYWQIKASKIMVLAPGEWTISNAVLYIGRIPFLYIPFFFFPGDEMFFSPVLGATPREGNYVQTTTYFVGKKDKKKSPFSFLRVTEGSQDSYATEIKGLFLKRIKSKTQTQQNKDWYLKLLIDLYSHLGGFAGVQFNFPPSIKFNGGIGISRSIFQESTFQYTVYAPNPYTDDHELIDHWNWTNFFGISLPVRFGLDTNFVFSVPGSNITITGNMELYSDIFFRKDFYNRSEDMDLSKMIGLSQVSTTTAVESERRQFTWSVRSTMDLSAYMPKPFLTRTSIDQLNLELSWLSKAAPVPADPYEMTLYAVDPAQEFYYPDRLVLPYLKTTIQGDLFTLSTSKIQPAIPEVLQSDPGKGYRTPETVLAMQEEQKIVSLEEAKPDLVLPSIKESGPTIVFKSRESTFRMSYLISPMLQLENQFDPAGWETGDDIDYQLKYSHFTNEIPFTLISTATIYGDLLLLDNRLTFNSVYRTRFNRTPDIMSMPDLTWETLVNSDLASTYVKLGNNSVVTLRPFSETLGFQGTVLNYRLNWFFYEYKWDTNESVFAGTGPLWNTTTVSLHSCDVTFRYETPGSAVQLKMISTIQPILPKVEAYFDFNIWLLQTNAKSIATEKQNTGIGELDDKITFDDSSVTESLTIDQWLFLSQQVRYYRPNLTQFLMNLEMSSIMRVWKPTSSSAYFLEQELVYDPVTPEFVRSSSMMTYGPFRARFDAEKVAERTGFNDAVGSLIFSSQKKFLPNKLEVSYNATIAEYNFWKQRIGLNVSISSNLVYYFQNFIDSNLNFSLNATFTIAEFLLITFRSVSYNSDIYRYVPGVPEIVGYTWINPITDFLSSFNFFNVEDRYNSNFKLGSLSVEVTHDMYDWELSCIFKGIYERVGTLWQWRPTLAISLHWKHIPEIKKEIEYADDTVNIFK